MPTYAVLGATGSTGSSIFRYLYERDDDVKLNIYARSASKVQSMHPFVRDAKHIRIFTGDLDDAKVFQQCIKGADVIFSAVAQNTNQVGCSVAQQTATTLVAALEALREQDASFKCPTVVVLSSANLDPVFRAQEPWLLKQIIDRGSYYIYADVSKAIKYLEQRAWIPLICAQPAALVQDVARGFELSQTEVSPFLSYEDLGRGMVKLAEDGDGKKWIGEKVGLTATGKPQGSVMPLLKYQFWGLLTYYFGWP